MSMAEERIVLKSKSVAKQLAELQAFVGRAAQLGTAIHKVEEGIWDGLLQMGRSLLGQFLEQQGDGDMGESVALPNGQECRRLEGRHERRYVSIFGVFRLQRAVYGSREGQKLDFVPLDNRLQLPASAFSYLLQDWDQSLCVEQAFGQASTTIARILRLKQSVDSLERMNQEMAEGATEFLLNRPAPAAEGDILVMSADGKGVVMRRSANEPAPKAHRTKGEKASKKRMATVATVYTVDRHRRTPEQVVAALFRDGVEQPARPSPQGKEVWASLQRDEPTPTGMEAAFAWLLGRQIMRCPQRDRPMVFLSDGQESLWDARQRWLPGAVMDILDLLHVTPRLWQAAHAFHAEKSDGAEQFVRVRLLRILHGKASDVIRGLRQMATKQGLTGSRKKTISTVCTYLRANLHRMRYDEYLAAGFPIASGAVEGACRHLVKDRLERAGMHWTITGAQAMLDVRSIHVSGLWDEYQSARIEREAVKLYPHQHLVAHAA